ncbi:hypothetical protein FO519_002880 [Halicephalobus sp. NKZ332]|nr:hypothetical protein FO519_002880 [Halicephalobus sp. NKZ332]
MLSLLSLLLASGTVLRADTEEWTPLTYPDPRTNFTVCNTWQNSTLCDPDHILTDQWRAEINSNINRQIEKLKNANILYTDTAPPECHDNSTEGVQIFVILAKRIQTANNQTITNQELIDFGDKLAAEFGLTEQVCKNYLLLIGVEAAKTAYTRTGKDLKLPEDLMVRIYNQSENVFKEKNYMEGLNKMIDEIGEQMIDPFKEETVEPPVEEDNSITTVSTIDDVMNTTINEVLEASTKPTEEIKMIVTPWWMFLLMAIAILMTIIALTLLGISRVHALKRMQIQTVIPRSATMKSNCPSEDSDGGEFATVTILRELGMDDQSTFGHIDIDVNKDHQETNNEDHLEIHVVDESEPNPVPEDLVHESQVVEEDQLEIRSESKTEKPEIQEEIPNEDKEKEYLPQCNVPLYSDQLSTDVIVPKISSPECDDLPNSPCTQSSTNEKKNDYNENVISAF